MVKVVLKLTLKKLFEIEIQTHIQKVSLFLFESVTKYWVKSSLGGLGTLIMKIACKMLNSVWIGQLCDNP